jgi:hypothetical protein
MSGGRVCFGAGSATLTTDEAMTALPPGANSRAAPDRRAGIDYLVRGFPGVNKRALGL